MRPSTWGLWCALYQIDPWDANRADLGFGMVASVIANVNRDPKKKAQPFSASDFMPYREQQRSDADRQRDMNRKVKAFLTTLQKPK